MTYVGNLLGKIFNFVAALTGDTRVYVLLYMGLDTILLKPKIFRVIFLLEWSSGGHACIGTLPR